MSHKITAIYENGVLRPLTPLDLPEHSSVEIDVQQVSTAPSAKESLATRARQALIAAGVSSPQIESQTNVSILSAERRAELARLFSTTRPLGEFISEDREGR